MVYGARYKKIELMAYNADDDDFKPVYGTEDNELTTFDATTYARIGAPAGVSLAADIAAIKGVVDDILTEVGVIDGLHDVPAQNSTDNVVMSDVIGNKTDSVAATSIYAYVAWLKAQHLVSLQDTTSNVTIGTTIGNKTDTVGGTSLVSLNKINKAAIDIIDGFHDVAAQDTANNAQMRDVIGNKTDTSGGDSLYTYATTNYNNILANYNRIGAPAGASVSADILAIKGVVDDILTDTATTIPGTIATVDANVDEIKNATRVEIDRFHTNQTNWVGSNDAAANGASETAWANRVSNQLSCKLAIDVSADVANNAIWANSSLSQAVGGCTVASFWLKLPLDLDEMEVFIVVLGSSSTNYAYWYFARDVLSPGQNRIILDLNNPDGTGGSGWTPATTISYGRIQINYTASQGDFDMYVAEWYAYKSDDGILKHPRNLQTRRLDVQRVYNELSAIQKVYPNLDVGVVVTADAAGAATPWVLGAFATIAAASAITSDYHVTGVALDEFSDTTDEYQVNLYYGDSDVFFGSVAVDAAKFHGGESLTIQSPLIPANSRIRAKLASEDGDGATCRVKIYYHEHS